MTFKSDDYCTCISYLFILHFPSHRRHKLDEVEKHERLPPHVNCVRFYRAWEERLHLYIQTELCLMRYIVHVMNIPNPVAYVHVHVYMYKESLISIYTSVHVVWYSIRIIVHVHVGVYCIGIV